MKFDIYIVTGKVTKDEDGKEKKPASFKGVLATELCKSLAKVNEAEIESMIQRMPKAIALKHVSQAEAAHIVDCLKWCMREEAPPTNGNLLKAHSAVLGLKPTSKAAKSSLGSID